MSHSNLWALTLRKMQHHWRFVISCDMILFLSYFIKRSLWRLYWKAILKEINPECSLEGLMLTLKLQYFGHLMQRANSLAKTDAGKDWGQEENGVTEDKKVGWHHQLNEHEFEQTLGDSEGWESLVCWNPLGHKDGTWPRGWTTKQLERRSFHQLRWGNLKGMEIRKPVLGMLNWRCLENSEIHWKTIYLLS